MELLTTVSQWIDRARILLAKDAQIPLIDGLYLDATDELVDAWMYGDLQYSISSTDAGRHGTNVPELPAHSQNTVIHVHLVAGGRAWFESSLRHDLCYCSDNAGVN